MSKETEQAKKLLDVMQEQIDELHTESNAPHIADKLDATLAKLKKIIVAFK